MLLILAGTSDARNLAVGVAQAGYSVLATVVTENAAIALREANLSVQVGRLTARDFLEVFREFKVTGVIDASHPFAEEAHRSVMEATEKAGLPFIRFERRGLRYRGYDLMTEVSSYQEAADLATETEGLVFLTTGSKTLPLFARTIAPERIIIRMLPLVENVRMAFELGIPQKQIVGMQGPFSREMNLAFYRHFKPSLMVTKESGSSGSVEEKVETALEINLPVILINRPQLKYGMTCYALDEVLEAIDAWDGKGE